MIKLEHTVLPSAEQMRFVIEGMRNPMNSWNKSDSYSTKIVNEETDNEADFEFFIGDNDLDLMRRLSKAGTEHRKYMRMMPVFVRITAPLYWWKEFDTYKLGTVANSTSTMHKIHSKEFTLDDFSTEHLMDLEKIALAQWILTLNAERKSFIETNDKDIWWQMIQLLPSSYNQTRNIMLNYEVLANMYRQRKNHKLDEWREFCKWIKELPYSELIAPETKQDVFDDDLK